MTKMGAQTTRQRILHLLKERGQATVYELSQELGVTAATIRHHLTALRKEGLVAAPAPQPRHTRGRPQHIYTLAESATHLFPRQYARLAHQLVQEMRQHLSPEVLTQAMERIGRRIADQAALPDSGEFELKLVAAVQFLNELGYMARWEQTKDGDFLIYIANCPYEQVSRRNQEVCSIDEALLSRLFGAPPQRIAWEGTPNNSQCVYCIHPPNTSNSV
ncbi:MAG TPA: ArsR family transcriptional regulator [Chloroflexi bacterium]|nr:ArsR family transcriptional regulator [Chloroflexota bacterium]